MDNGFFYGTVAFLLKIVSVGYRKFLFTRFIQLLRYVIIYYVILFVVSEFSKVRQNTLLQTTNSFRHYSSWIIKYNNNTFLVHQNYFINIIYCSLLYNVVIMYNIPTYYFYYLIIIYFFYPECNEKCIGFIIYCA